MSNGETDRHTDRHRKIERERKIERGTHTHTHTQTLKTQTCSSTMDLTESRSPFLMLHCRSLIAAVGRERHKREKKGVEGSCFGIAAFCRVYSSVQSENTANCSFK